MLQFTLKAADARALPPHLLSDKPGRRQAANVLHLPPRSSIFLQGYGRAPQYRVIEGCVALSQSLPDGRRQIIDMVGPGRLLGVGVGERNRCSADTLSYVTLEPATEIDHPDLEQALEEMVLRAQSHATLLGRKNAPERVASAILDLADQFVRPSRSKRETICFNLHPTRGELADWLGLTVETVSRCFTRLKRAGLIEFRHPEIVALLQPQALADIAAGNRAIDNANAA